jgi:hypothetical protein
MITEYQFRELATCLETGKSSVALWGITVMADTVVEGSDGAYAELYLQRTKLKISSLLEKWSAGEVKAISVEVKTAQGIKRGCVQRCEDGTVQRGLCSETGDDILHCIEALKGRCGG